MEPNSKRRRVVVFEKRHRWMPELRRQWIDRAVQVTACRSVADLPGSSVAQSDAPLVLLDFDSDPASCLMFLGKRSASRWTAPVVLILSPETDELQWTLRELGVNCVLDSRSDGGLVARSCWRLLAADVAARLD